MADATSDAQRALIDAFRQQAKVCGDTGSPLYQALLERAADDLAAGGPFAALFDGWSGHPVLDVPTLRAMGAVHALVLAGEAPELAAFYPSAGGRFEPEGAWRALRALVAARATDLRPRLRQHVQTNEVRRSCALLPGILRFAAAAGGRPLRLREIGPSAGLNLLFDRYRYRLGDLAWGATDARLALACEWRGTRPALGPMPPVVERLGCDVDPIDVRDPAARVRLLSYLWPDQLERLARMRAAIEIAREDPPALVRARAGDWLEGSLAPAAGTATLLFHSSMWWYVPRDEQARILAIGEAAGALATADAPFGWLRKEPARLDEDELRLRTWPGGEDVLLGRSHPHGEWVEWLV
jgi:hypothetical protein